MSLLDSGAVYQSITVYPQELVTDEDGNPRTQPSTSGTAAVARFQPLLQTGTSSRLQESDNQGFESQQVYNMRFPRGQFEDLGPQSEIEWGTTAAGNPQRWAVYGFPVLRNNSPATAHVVYQVERR